MTPATWSRAWSDASRRFWADKDPADHFTTSAGPLVADRLAALVREVDVRLGHPDPLHVIDIGCGDGRLLALVRERSGDLADRVQWVGVDVRPFDVPGVESLVCEAPCDLALGVVHGLVTAHEWLDEIPCDVVERDDDGVDRLVLVHRDGGEILGPDLKDGHACAEYGVDAAQARSWIERWWPLQEPGDRAEIGIARDRAWEWMAGLLASGTVLATDYGHTRPDRRMRFRDGSLAGYRHGRLVRPAPDGTTNLTAHVALDSCAAALEGTTVARQRDELVAAPLGEQPTAVDVERHFASLRLRGRERLGGMGWLRWDA